MAGVDFRGYQQQIDVSQLVMFQSEWPATASLLRANSVQISCFSTSIALACPQAERWDAMLDETRRYCDLAHRCQCGLLRIFAGVVPREMNFAESLQLCRRHLRQLVKIAWPMGCRLVLETHDDWSATARMMQLLDGFDPKQTSVVWDIQHTTNAGETPGQSAKNLGEFLGYVHCKDMIKMPDGRIVQKTCGQGTLPLRDILLTLQSSGYEGWLCLECEKRWQAEAPEPEQSIPAFARYVRSCLPDV